MSGIADRAFGGFQVGGIFNVRSGVPIDVLITRPDIAYVGNTTSAYAGQVFSSPVLVGGVVQTTAVVNVPGGGNTRNIRRPNVVPGLSPFLRQNVATSATANAFEFLNPAAFSVPAPGTFGNSRRNNYSGPGLEQLDLTLGKAVPVTERVKVDLKLEVFNVLNHPNFANPGTVRLSQGLPSSPASTNAIQPGTPYPVANNLATAGSSFGSYSSTVSNTVGIGTNRDLQLSARITF